MRYGVYANEGGDGYLLDVQTDLLDGLNTRVVVPLLPIALAPKPATRLNLVFRIGNADYVMATQFMAAVPLAALTQTTADLLPEHDRIVAALDMLFQGI